MMVNLSMVNEACSSPGGLVYFFGQGCTILPVHTPLLNAFAASQPESGMQLYTEADSDAAPPVHYTVLQQLLQPLHAQHSVCLASHT